MKFKSKKEFLKYYDKYLSFFEGSVEDLAQLNIWSILLDFEEFVLIKKLFRASAGAPGYGTLVVPKKGFCKYKYVNKAVISWLRYKGINVIDVREEIQGLQDSLKSI